MFAERDLTEDRLLGGRVCLSQPKRGYRAATDPVLLAAAVAAKRGDRVLDVGCGAGAAMACLSARIEGVEAHGLETQPGYAALAGGNAPGARIWRGDLFDPPTELRRICFDWAMTNPPYFDVADPASPDAGRDVARRETAPVATWVAATLKRVRSGGRLAVIHKADRLPGVLAGLDGAGDVRVTPLQSRIGRDAGRVIVTARKGARGPASLAPALILHDGPRHDGDGDDFSAAAQRILRDGAALG